MVVFLLWCVAGLLALAAVAIALNGKAQATPVIYGGSFAATLLGLIFATQFLLSDAPPSEITLPVGLAWLGAHFRVDPLSAFFLIVVNLGAAGASLFAVGYGRHERAPSRVLPFYPAFLAG